MKIKLFFLVLFTICSWKQLQSQILINNTGNHLQSYPKVTAESHSVRAMVDQVDTNELYNSIKWMQDLGCREAMSLEAQQTQDWLVDRLESYGLEVSIYQFVPWHADGYGGDTLAAGNVIAVQYGTEFPDEYIIITSHYDHQSGPGADDNASGTAGMLECARILSRYSFKRSILYISFNAEEYWMFGSRPLAEWYAREDKNILGVFNLDMIGFLPEHVEEIELYSGHYPISKRLFEYFQQVGSLYTGVQIQRFSTKDSWGGDHMPFHFQGYPALYIGDVEYIWEHPHYHRLSDTIGAGVNSFALAEAFTQATLASVAELANGWLPPQHFRALPGNAEVNLYWDVAPGAVKYRIYKNDRFIAETTDTHYRDVQVANNNSYFYCVTAVDYHSTEGAISNVDTAKPSPALSLPYFNDFQENTNGLGVISDVWTLSNIGVNKVLERKDISSSQDIDKIPSILETQWFSLESINEDVSLSFDLKGTFDSYLGYVAVLAVEITTDRKRWDEIALFQGGYDSLRMYTFSLNEYRNNPFVQIRFRLELGDAFIDNLAINIGSSSVGGDSGPCFMLKPNPTMGVIYIETDLMESFIATVYDMNGRRLFSKEMSSEGKLDLSYLAKGIYLVKIQSGSFTVTQKVILR